MFCVFGKLLKYNKVSLDVLINLFTTEYCKVCSMANLEDVLACVVLATCNVIAICNEIHKIGNIEFNLLISITFNIVNELQPFIGDLVLKRALLFDLNHIHHQ